LQIDELIAELLLTGQMNDDTTADLNRMLEEYKAGRLDPEDEAYLRALHGRLTGAPAPEGEPGPAAEQRIDGLTIAEWRDRALRAEEELALLKDQVAGSP
jgi:hypothetical protein